MRSSANYNINMYIPTNINISLALVHATYNVFGTTSVFSCFA